MNIFCGKKSFIGIMILSCAGFGFVSAMQSDTPEWAKKSKLRANRRDMVPLLSCALAAVQEVRAEVFNIDSRIIYKYSQGIVDAKRAQLSYCFRDNYELVWAILEFDTWKETVRNLLKHGVSSIPSLNVKGWQLLPSMEVSLTPLAKEDELNLYRLDEAEERATQLGCPPYEDRRG